MAAAKKNSTYLLAFSSVLCAVAVMLMFATGLFPFATYAIPAAAGAFLMAVYIEAGPKYAYMVFIGAAILSLFLCADKEAAVLFALFFGHYPVTKAYVERIRFTPLCWAVKIILFNLLVVASYYIVFSLFMTPQLLEDFSDFGKYTAIILMGMGNLVFILYDVGLTRVVTLYVRVIGPKYISKLLRK